MSEQNADVVVVADPAFGPWLSKEITPEMVRGKMLWVTMNINRVRRELHAAEDAALKAKWAWEDAYAAAYKVAQRQGATSHTDADRTASGLENVREAKRAREKADLEVKRLRDELDEYYRAQMPATQSLNRVVLAEWQAEWAAAGGSYQG